MIIISISLALKVKKP